MRWRPGACESMKALLVASRDLDYKWWRTTAPLTEQEAGVMQAHLDLFQTTLLADGTAAAFVSFERGAKWVDDEFPGQSVPGPDHVLRYEEGGYYVHAVSGLQVRSLPRVTLAEAGIR